MKIEIPGEPVAQGRPKATTVNGRARVYDPAKSRNWKATAQQHMLAQRANGAVLDGPLAVTITAIFTMPKSRYRKREPRPREWHTKRPDADNIAKCVKDAGTGVLWMDDSQIAVLTVEKVTGAQGEAPGVIVEVLPIKEPGREWAQPKVTEGARA